MSKIFKIKGFTLVETLIYVALFGMLSVFLIYSLTTMLKSYTEMRARHDVLNSARVVLERITREVRGADSIDTASSTLGSSPGVLKLNTTDSGGTAKTVQFSKNGTSGLIEILDSADGTARVLSGSKVSVSSLVFRNITTSSGEAVRVELTLQQLRGGSSGSSYSFYDTIALRGSY